MAAGRRQASVAALWHLSQPSTRAVTGEPVPQLLDCLLACPDCGGLPTFRRGCRACSSTSVTRQRLLHHFACAHVGPQHEFEDQQQLVCPKCRTNRLVVGTDVEYLSSPYQCLDCDWSDVSLETIGRCMACGSEFTEAAAFEEEMVGYHVERLELLDIVAGH